MTPTLRPLRSPLPPVRPPTVANIWALATVATLFVAVVVWLPSARSGTEVELMRPGRDGPSRAVFDRDFPAYELPRGEGHDGQEFYAIAASPLDPQGTAPLLWPPRYRLQRIAFPLLARVVHPGGPGLGLVRALILVNVLGVLLLGVATGLLSRLLGGRTWVAAVPALLPGSLLGLGLGTPEALACGSALLAVVLSLRGRHRLAVATGVLAVLTREVHLLILIGFALWRRDRAGLWLAAVPAAAFAGWAGFLRLVVTSETPRPREFRTLGPGWVEAVRHWLDGQELLSLGFLVLTALLLALVVRRVGVWTPLSGILALQLLLLAPLSADVVAHDGNLLRALLPTMTLVVVACSLPGRGAVRA